MIELCHVQAGYPNHIVLRDISIVFSPGKVLALLGPNGCGKSTLLRTVLALQPKMAGEILYDGILSEQLSSRQIARKAAYLPQSRPVPNSTARRMVLHGRFPYLSYPRRYRPEDYQIAEQALQWAGAADVSDCLMTELSGGQRQKVYLAMALAQQTENIFMDEPTTWLDIRRQIEIMQMARHLAQEQHRAVILVLHDLCQALRFCDEIAVLSRGRILLSDTPENIYQSGILDEVFEITLRRFISATGWQYYYE